MLQFGQVKVLSIFNFNLDNLGRIVAQLNDIAEYLILIIIFNTITVRFCLSSSRNWFTGVALP